ncbi:hypothetical protein IGA_04308 [Bacillus cereus HuA3-9]|uniref:Uncharacterized protein n=1 Tax=Bacillus cereus HuA3-9 TaxID=1053205 RepID=R8CSK3_BACCE|nr:hypothetical protein IGA_04308 [Bacillus cereus HuA3-9]
MDAAPAKSLAFVIVDLNLTNMFILATLFKGNGKECYLELI